MLEVIDLVKEFDRITAVSGVDFQVQPGEIFALLGPNGAGKTTTLRMLMNILKPDRGEIKYNDVPRIKLKREMFGYLPEERGLYQRAVAMDLLVYLGQLNGLTKHRSEVEAIRFLDRLGLIEYTHHRIHELSKGLQQKIQFIIACLHNPEILILDEPFAGLDPVNRLVLYEIIEQNRQEGKIILISTHQMNEIENLTDSLCLMNQGRVILSGKFPEIKKKFRENAYFIEVEDNLDALRKTSGIEILEEKNQSCKFVLKKSEAAKTKIIQSLFEKMKIKKLIQVEPSLNDIFLKAIQKDHNEQNK